MKIIVVPVTPFQQNCSILYCEETRRAAVVDPGGDIERIMAQAKEENLEIEKILITHGHVDHASPRAQRMAYPHNSRVIPHRCITS
jgi:glyoxylase-like metal-dependent hydrolase (beta-lactamase superfamily II)